MSPTTNPSAESLRSKYAFLFGTIAQLHSFYYGERISTRFEEIKKVVVEMHNDEKIDDYFFSNLEDLFDLYPQLLPSVVSQGFKNDAVSEKSKLAKIEALLNCMISEACGLVRDYIEEDKAHYEESILRKF